MARETAADATTAATNGTDAPEAPSAEPVETPTEQEFEHDRQVTGRTGPSPRTILMAAGATIAGAVALGALTSRATLSGPMLDGTEPVAMRLRPRKVLWRYLTTIGLWEATRRRTRYTLTDRHLVVEKGLMNRQVSSLPLARVTDVAVRTGLWQGFVDVIGADRDGRTSASIGPLRAPVARRLGEAVARGAYPGR
jgi:hypothetical protein